MIEFIPVELLILGTSIQLQKNTVSSKEVSEFKKLCPYKLEYDSENQLFYSTYDEKSDMYTIKNNLRLPPQVIKLLMEMAKV